MTSYFWGSLFLGFAVIGMTIAAAVVDYLRYCKYKKELSDEDKKKIQLYQPNLQLWGLGALVGVASATMYLFAELVQGLFNKPLDPLVQLTGLTQQKIDIIGSTTMIYEFIFWQNLAVLIVVVIVLIGAVAGLIKLLSV